MPRHNHPNLSSPASPTPSPNPSNSVFEPVRKSSRRKLPPAKPPSKPSIPQPIPPQSSRISQKSSQLNVSRPQEKPFSPRQTSLLRHPTLPKQEPFKSEPRLLRISSADLDIDAPFTPNRKSARSAISSPSAKSRPIIQPFSLRGALQQFANVKQEPPVMRRSFLGAWAKVEDMPFSLAARPKRTASHSGFVDRSAVSVATSSFGPSPGVKTSRAEGVDALQKNVGRLKRPFSEGADVSGGKRQRVGEGKFGFAGGCPFQPVKSTSSARRAAMTKAPGQDGKVDKSLGVDRDGKRAGFVAEKDAAVLPRVSVSSRNISEGVEKNKAGVKMVVDSVAKPGHGNKFYIPSVHPSSGGGRISSDECLEIPVESGSQKGKRRDSTPKRTRPGQKVRQGVVLSEPIVLDSDEDSSKHRESEKEIEKKKSEERGKSVLLRLPLRPPSFRCLSKNSPEREKNWEDETEQVLDGSVETGAKLVPADSADGATGNEIVTDGMRRGAAVRTGWADEGLKSAGKEGAVEMVQELLNEVLGTCFSSVSRFAGVETNAPSVAATKLIPARLRIRMKTPLDVDMSEPADVFRVAGGINAGETEGVGRDWQMK